MLDVGINLVSAAMRGHGASAPTFTVLDSDGNSFAVPLTVKDSDGNSFSVSTSVLDSDGNSFTV